MSLVAGRSTQPVPQEESIDAATSVGGGAGAGAGDVGNGKVARGVGEGPEEWATAAAATAGGKRVTLRTGSVRREREERVRSYKQKN